MRPVGGDGLCVGGCWRTATTLVEKGMMNPFRFRLFAQATAWKPGELERELGAGAWRVARGARCAAPARLELRA